MDNYSAINCVIFARLKQLKDKIILDDFSGIDDFVHSFLQVEI